MTRGEELAWCAALFEGEGCLSRHRLAWQVVIKMSDEDVVRKLHSLMGIGNIYARQSRQPCADGTARKPTWEWYIGSQEDVLNFCALLAPHMGERRAAKMADCIADLTCSNGERSPGGPLGG